MQRLLFVTLILFLLMSCLAVHQQNSSQQMLSIQWQVKTTLPQLNGETNLGVAGPVAGIVNNILLVAGGANFTGKKPWYGGIKTYHKDIYLFSKNDHHAIKSIGSSGQQLPEAIGYPANIGVPDGLIIAGGENESGIKDQVIKITIDKDLKISFAAMPSLPVPLTCAGGIYNNGFLYVAGGETKSGTSNKLYRLNTQIQGAGWQTMTDMPAAVAFGVVALQKNGSNDCIYVIGGRSKMASPLSTIYNTVYCYNIQENKWTLKKSLPNTLSAGTGLATGKDGILIIGGDEGPIFSKLEVLNRDIAAAVTSNEKEKLTNEKLAIVENHPGFSKKVWLYNTVTDQYTALSDFPEGSSVTTTALLWGNDVVIPSGEIRPAVRTPNIWSGTIK